MLANLSNFYCNVININRMRKLMRLETDNIEVTYTTPNNEQRQLLLLYSVGV